MDSSSPDPLPPDNLKALQSEDLYLYGLIGNPLTHSFSQKYFNDKFSKEKLRDHRYELFPLDDIDDIRLLLEVHKNLRGLNVTIPFKESVISYLDEMDPVAAEIGAVNCIQIDEFEKIGYNTDWLGFRDSIRPHLKNRHHKALVLGSGGSSKAICYALDQMGIDFKIVSRSPEDNELAYQSLDQKLISEFPLLINTTPLGMYPAIDACPDIPYEGIGADHICFDLVYNPDPTLFLQKCREKNAITISGARMLALQAEHAWNIWRKAEEEEDDL
jgi:shikimate dehydrogenase